MIAFFVKRPVTTIMMVSLFVIMGIVSLSGMLVEQTPKVDFPIITITTEYPGATPVEVETLVINKIEDAVAEISEIEKVRSISYDNVGFVFVQFLLSADVNVKSIEVKDKVEAILNDLPDDIEQPIIEKYDPLMQPVIELVLSSESMNIRDIYEYADKTLKNKFSSIEGVAKVDVYGGKQRQINVRLNPVLLKQKYITVEEVVSQLSNKNKNIPGGEIEKGFSSLSVRFVGEFQNVDEIKNLELQSIDGNKFLLSDVADIQDSFKKVNTIARYNGKEVVGLSLNKVSDGNAVNIAREVMQRIDEFRAMLPKGVDMEIASNTTNFIVNETTDAQFNIAIGIFLTIIILYLFTGQAKLTFIAALVIPTSIVSTFWPMSGSDFTINFMTLLAIAMALGTLIANAIVIIENVLEHMEHNESAQNAAITGTKEVAGAIIASTGTNLVVFTPIAMMGGIVGKFFVSFGVTVIYATLFSLLASFTLTPMLCGLLLKKRKAAPAKTKSALLNAFTAPVRLTERMMNFMKIEYKRIFNAVFRHPVLTCLVVFLSLWSLRFVMPYLGSEFIPADDEDKVQVNLVMPKGVTIDRTLSVIEKIEVKVAELPEVESYLSNIGENGVENASIIVSLIPSKDRQRSDSDIIDVLTPFMSDIPDAEINMLRAGMESQGNGDISINISGDDYNQVINYAWKMKQIMQQSGYFRSVDSSYKMPKKEIRFIPDQQKLNEYGLSSAQIAGMMRDSIYGNTDNVYKEKGEEYDINIELDDKYMTNFDDVKQILVSSAQGMIPVTELGTLVDDKSLPTIRHRDRNRVIRLEGFLSKSNAGFVRGLLDKKFSELGMSAEYGYAYVEDAEHEAEASEEMAKAFILAVILTYMLLAAILNSGSYPISIMMTVLTSFVGVFYTMFFLGYSMGVTSMMGMVMLVGLVVNNAILLLDYTILKMKEGLPVKEALWQGASVKFRAIIMTSLAIVLGVMPQLWAMMGAKRAMGAVMVGGMLASIVYTLIFIPIVFWFTCNIEEFIKSKIGKR